MTFAEILLLALSLSVDSFVVSLGGSVTLGRINIWKILSVAAVFGIVQAVCLFAGWISGYSIVAYVSKIAPYVALVILSYLGVRMIISGARGNDESVDLAGFRNMILAAVATSIDAVAVVPVVAELFDSVHEALLIAFTCELQKASFDH